MKKLLSIILILALAVPALAVADDYTPDLGMTMQDYILKYNSLPAPLGAPYSILDQPYMWSTMNEYNLAWFYADESKNVSIILMSKEKSKGKSIDSGLDEIQISMKNDSDFVPFISIAVRCATPFAADVLGTSLASQRIGEVLRYYYESNAKEKGLYAYWTLDTDGKLAISFYYQFNYLFQISTVEAVK